jgi:hypothetical protein
MIARSLIIVLFLTLATAALAEDVVQPVQRDFFKRHQQEDGSWDEATIHAHCPGQPACPPNPAAVRSMPVATTSLGMLAYFGAGYDHRMPSKNKAMMKKAHAYLLSRVGDNGALSDHPAEHAIATLALAECYGMSKDPAMKAQTQRALSYMLALRAPLGDGKPGAWSADPENSQRLDTWTTTWAVMAMVTAQAADLDVGDGLARAGDWCTLAWELANPGHDKLTATSTSRFPEFIEMHGGTATASTGSMTNAGLLTAVFTGRPAGDVARESLANALLADAEKESTTNDAWCRWISALGISTALEPDDVRRQDWLRAVTVDFPLRRKSGDCIDGSVDADGIVRGGGLTGGRMNTTSFSILATEVVYRAPLRKNEMPSQPTSP